MASLKNALNRNFLDSVLPTFGSRCEKTYSWISGYGMFTVDEYTSKAGNHGCIGIRFSEDYAIVEKLGLYHTFHYLNELTLLVRKEGRWSQVEKRDSYDKVFLDNEYVRRESTEMIKTYLASAPGIQIMKDIEKEATSIVDRFYSPTPGRETNDKLIEIVESLKSE